MLGQTDNFSGDVTVTAPTGGYTIGLVYQLNSGAWCVARQTVAAAASCLVHILNDQPVWASKVAATGKALAVGQDAYYVSGTKNITPSSTGNTLVGTCVKAATATDTKVLITSPAAT
jgi:hypothetical protein